MKQVGWLTIFGWLIGLMLLGLHALPAAAQGDVGASLSASTDTITVGDPITMTVTILHPASHQVIIPRLGPTWGDFEVRSQGKADTTIHENGRATTEAGFVVTLFAPGEYQTPEMVVTLSDPEGNATDESLAPLTVTVASVLRAEDQTLRDLKAQAEMTPPPIWPWLLLGAALAVLLFLGGGWLLRRLPRTPAQSAAVAQDTRPAYAVAYEELDRIEGLALPEKGEYKAYYTLVADCLRRYLEGQFGVPAMERTTPEIRRDLRRSVVSIELAGRIIRLFEESDLVKFAKYVPTLLAAQELLFQARDLIDRTRPQAQGGDGESGVKHQTAQQVRSVPAHSMGGSVLDREERQGREG
jgi:hypothetical protein